MKLKMTSRTVTSETFKSNRHRHRHRRTERGKEGGRERESFGTEVNGILGFKFIIREGAKRSDPAERISSNDDGGF